MEVELDPKRKKEESGLRQELAQVAKDGKKGWMIVDASAEEGVAEVKGVFADEFEKGVSGQSRFPCRLLSHFRKRALTSVCYIDRSAHQPRTSAEATFRSRTALSSSRSLPVGSRPSTTSPSVASSSPRGRPEVSSSSRTSRTTGKIQLEPLRPHLCTSLR